MGSPRPEACRNRPKNSRGPASKDPARPPPTNPPGRFFRRPSACCTMGPTGCAADQGPNTYAAHYHTQSVGVRPRRGPENKVATRNIGLPAVWGPARQLSHSPSPVRRKGWGPAPPGRPRPGRLPQQNLPPAFLPHGQGRMDSRESGKNGAAPQALYLPAARARAQAGGVGDCGGPYPDEAQQDGVGQTACPGNDIGVSRSGVDCPPTYTS